MKQLKPLLSNQMMQRYKANTFPELARRVSDQLGNNCKATSNKYHQLISRQRFIPSGNTLLAGIDPIRPNCSIFPSIDEHNFDSLSQRATTAWSDRIGIGFDLSNAADPVSILHRLSTINASIKLGHRPQRGNMAVLNSKHPQIEEFLHCKSTTTNNESLYNFNISVGLNDDFDDNILSLCAESAYKSGDPGIVFLDRIQDVPAANNIGTRVHLPELGHIKTVVPCGEQGMFDNEVCTLGSINLSCSDYWQGNKLNEAMFCDAIATAVRFLDDVVDKMQFNDDELRRQSFNTRRIGLGIMGFADVLHHLGIEYGSVESLKLVDDIGSVFQSAAHMASEVLSDEKGVCPALEGTDIKRRNITITCIPPTGGITLLTSNKGFGIEPYFEEANTISPENHIGMQAAWQKYVDNSISKTVNLDSTATRKDIEWIWNCAKECDLKSITVYRDGSKLFQPMSGKSTPDCPNGKCDL